MILVNKRIYYLDLLRVFAIITIIACHVSGAFKFNYIMHHGNSMLYFYVISFFNHLSQIGVPIFIMISGALLINKKDTLISFFKKRFTRVVLPFLFWALIFILLDIFVFNKTISLELFSNIIFASPNSHGHILWFVWMIIVVYCLIFSFNKIIHTLDLEKHLNKIVAILSIIFVIYCCVFTPTDQITYYLSFFGFALLGFCLNEYVFKLNSKTIMIIGFLIVISLYVYYIIYMCYPLSFKQNRFAGTSIFHVLNLIITICIFISFKQVTGKYLNKIIYSISTNSYGIYFVHYIFLIVFSHLLKSFEIFHRNPIKIIPILTLILLFSSWFVIFIMGKIPYLKYFSGHS